MTELGCNNSQETCLERIPMLPACNIHASPAYNHLNWIKSIHMNGKSFRFCVLVSHIQNFYPPVHDGADLTKMQNRKKIVCYVKDTEAHTGKFKRYTLWIKMFFYLIWIYIFFHLSFSWRVCSVLLHISEEGVAEWKG